MRRVVRLYREAFSGVPRDVWMLSVAALVNRAGSMVLPFLSLYLTAERGLGVALAGQLVGLYGAGSIAGSYLGGWLTDRLGGLRTQTLSLVVSGFAYLAFLWLESVASLAVGIFLAALTADAYRPAAMAEIAARAGEAGASRAFAALRLCINVGMGIGPAFGGLLARHDYRLLFIGEALTCWGAAVMLLWGLSARGRGPGAAPLVPGSSPWRDTGFLRILVAVLLLGMVFLQAFSTLPLYFTSAYGMAEDGVGGLLGWNALLIVLFEMVLIHLVSRYRAGSVAAVGSLLVCLGMGLTGSGSGALWALFTVTIWTFGEMLALPMFNTLIAERSSPENRGRYMGLYTMSFAASWVVAPVAGSLIYERWAPEALWGTILALALPLGLGVWLTTSGGRGRR